MKHPSTTFEGRSFEHEHLRRWLFCYGTDPISGNTATCRFPLPNWVFRGILVFCWNTEKFGQKAELEPEPPTESCFADRARSLASPNNISEGGSQNERCAKANLLLHLGFWMPAEARTRKRKTLDAKCDKDPALDSPTQVYMVGTVRQVVTSAKDSSRILL